jgi:hypothetical protein
MVLTLKHARQKLSPTTIDRNRESLLTPITTAP